MFTLIDAPKTAGMYCMRNELHHNISIRKNKRILNYMEKKIAYRNVKKGFITFI